MVDDANHGQVASGEIPSFVTEADIPSPITFEEAHTRCQEVIINTSPSQMSISRYAAAVAAFITMREFGLFSPEAVEEALNTIQTLEEFTDAFLEPFVVTSMMENGENMKYIS